MKKVYNREKGTCKVTFTLPTQAVGQASEVLLLGDFNNWNPNNAIALLPSADGSYKTTLELQTGKVYQYRFLLDQERWENDWNADGYIPSAMGNSDNSIVALEAVSLDENFPNNIADETSVLAKASIPAPAKEVHKEIVEPDDLTKIDGIGKKLAQVLNEQGIRSFADLASQKASELKELLIAVNPRYKMYSTTSWSQQARMAAKADWKGLRKLQKQLKEAKKK